MESRFLEKFLEETWGTWISVLIVNTVSVILGVFGYLKIVDTISEESFNGEIYHVLKIVATIAVMAALVAVNVWYVFFVIRKNTIRRVKRGKIGILMQLDAESTQIYDDIVRKFGDAFRNSIFDEFDVIFIPYKKSIATDEDTRKLLVKKDCVLFLKIRIETDCTGSETLYDMSLKATISHYPYEENIKEEFQRLFCVSLSKFHNMRFVSGQKIRDMRVKANQLSFACEYTVGISLYLNGNYTKAETVLVALLPRLPENGMWGAMRNSIQDARYEMYMTIAYYLKEKFSYSCDDMQLLDRLEEYLDKGNACKPRQAEYYMNKAYCCVARDGNVKKANEYLNTFKQLEQQNLTYRYSEAFFKAYKNQTLGGILTSYKSALKVEYNLEDIIVFIEAVLKKEPERYGLNLALGILYFECGDLELSNQNYEAYLTHCEDMEKARDIIIKRGFMNIKNG